MKIAAPKGTKDILPDEIYKWHFVENSFKEVCELFGYKETRIPTFESTEVFARGVGDTTDIVQKEMYTFLDKGGRSITLRPEGTAGVARSYVENGMGSLPAPVRLYYNITAFRYENVQKGRYREFHQLGLEAFGSEGPQIDAEIISLLVMFFDRIGVEGAKVRINSIGCPVCRDEYNNSLRAYLAPHMDSLCTLCKGRYDKNPLRVIDCKEKSCKVITADAPALVDNLCSECKTHFDELQVQLAILEVDYTIDKNIVRGLDYYTKTVFEFVSDHVGTQGTICGGGRYDGLIEQFEGQRTPGIGFALGIERLLMEIDAREVDIKHNTQEGIYFCFTDGKSEKLAREICLLLRRKNIKAETDLMNRSLKSQMKYAGKSSFSHVCVIGEDELESMTLKFRSLIDRSEDLVKISDIDKICYDAKGEILWPRA